MMWFLLYKFRRRHSSRYDEIEEFLQSDNHLMPIRYSYSDIKKMTRGFQEELGQGGYGTIYKGKLQSGYYSTEKNTVTLTAARGTISYVAHELMNRGFGGVSYKADVYSFGMVLMDMVGLMRDLIRNDEKSSHKYDHIEQDKDIEFHKAYEKNDDYGIDGTTEFAKKMTIVALWCIQMNPSDRPSMNKVVEMLEGRMENLQIPNRPSQSFQVAVNYEDQSWNTYSTDSTSLLCHDTTPSIKITVELLKIEKFVQKVVASL